MCARPADREGQERERRERDRAVVAVAARQLGFELALEVVHDGRLVPPAVQLPSAGPGDVVRHTLGLVVGELYVLLLGDAVKVLVEKWGCT